MISSTTSLRKIRHGDKRRKTHLEASGRGLSLIGRAGVKGRRELRFTAGLQLLQVFMGQLDNEQFGICKRNEGPRLHTDSSEVN